MQLVTRYRGTVMVLVWITGLASYSLDPALGPQVIPFLQTRWIKGAQRGSRSPCMYHGTLTTSSTLPITPPCYLSLGELVDLPRTLSGPCLTCFSVPAASKDIPISAGNAVRVLLVAEQLISLSLMQTASLGTEITSN